MRDTAALEAVAAEATEARDRRLVAAIEWARAEQFVWSEIAERLGTTKGNACQRYERTKRRLEEGI